MCGFASSLYFGSVSTELSINHNFANIKYTIIYINNINKK